MARRTIVLREDRARSVLSEIAGDDELYGDALRELLEACRGQGLRFRWGTAGVSIRVQTADRAEPLSIAWVFPSDRGWYGLRYLTLGVDTSSAEATPSVRSALDVYVDEVDAITGAEDLKSKTVRSNRFRPAAVVGSRRHITEAIANLVRRVNSGTGSDQ